MKEVKHTYRGNETPLYYQVLSPSGELLFKDACYAICNSFICTNMIQGVRPKPVWK